MDKLSLLLKVSTQLTKEKDLKKILRLLTSITKQLLNADICSIFLHNKITKELWTIVAEKTDEIRIPEDSGIAGYSFSNNETIIINDTENEPRFTGEVDRNLGYHTRNLVAVPLQDRFNSPFGVIEVINKLDNTSFDNEDIELLNHITLFVTTTIENSYLYEQLNTVHKDLVYKLSSVTRYKDKETQSHIIRVGLYSSIIAKELGWKQEEVELIKLSSPMHDIGKVGVPDNILLQPAPLNETQWDTMHQHCQIGYDILSGTESRLLQIASKIALEHHEKYDGSGYPFQLKAGDISIYARLTAIADVFDALTSKRPYKEPWSYDQAFNHMIINSGKHFDPMLMTLFLKNRAQIIKIKEEVSD